MKKMFIGLEDFKTMIENDLYYVDKTQLIEDVINSYVTLYTRPRRFGKTLNMSMLYYFFSNKEDTKEIFKGLKITENKEMMKHMNQYPVISITLKDLNASNMGEQLKYYASLISRTVIMNDYLFDSKELRESELSLLSDYEYRRSSQDELRDALSNLITWIYKTTHKKVILLIDEYDVPLNYAYEKGYYDEMVEFISGAFSSAFKSNPYLEKGVLTGCLRVARESIFTGMNNLRVRSVIDEDCSDCFGFTQVELDEMLEHYSLFEKRDLIREWYDGYLFGNTRIYNPWSVINYIQDLNSHRKRSDNLDLRPKMYWANTSGNSIVYDYIMKSDETLKEEFKQLTEGQTIIKSIRPELTYREMEDIKNIYSFLLFTGYLNIVSPAYDESGSIIKNTYELACPNKEVREIFDDCFIDWLSKVHRHIESELIKALLDKDIDLATKLLNDFLFRSLSYYDYGEDKYHGLLLGLLNHDGYRAVSNRESGEGRYDLFMYKDFESPSIIIECKKTDSKEELYSKAIEGINQIRERRYIEGKQAEGYKMIIAYSIAFYKKECMIIKTNS